MAQYEMRYSNAYYIPENWPLHTMKFTEQGALCEVFDRGVKPAYMSESMQNTLTFKHARIQCLLPDGSSLPEFAVEYASISVVKTGLLNINLVSQPLELNEAKKTMMQWLPYFAENKGKSEGDLDDFLAKVAADYSGYDDRNFGAAPEGFNGAWQASNGVGYGVRFQKAYSETLPLRIYFNIGWHYIRSKKERTDFFYPQIPAPEGYLIEVAESVGPDSTSEMKYAKGIPFLPGRGMSGSDQFDVIEKQDDDQITRDVNKMKKGNAFTGDPELTTKRNNFSIFIAGILGVVIFALSLKIWMSKSVREL